MAGGGRRGGWWEREGARALHYLMFMTDDRTRAAACGGPTRRRHPAGRRRAGGSGPGPIARGPGIPSLAHTHSGASRGRRRDGRRRGLESRQRAGAARAGGPPLPQTGVDGRPPHAGRAGRSGAESCSPLAWTPRPSPRPRGATRASGDPGRRVYSAMRARRRAMVGRALAEARRGRTPTDADQYTTEPAELRGRPPACTINPAADTGGGEEGGSICSADLRVLAVGRGGQRLLAGAIDGGRQAALQAERGQQRRSAPQPSVGLSLLERSISTAATDDSRLPFQEPGGK